MILQLIHSLKSKVKISSYWKDVFFQASGNTVAQIIGIAGIPILTRLYAPEAFAVQGIFIQIVTFLTAFISLRLEYFIPLLKNENQSSVFALWIFRISLVMAFLFTAVIFLLNNLDVSFFGQAGLSSYLYFAPLTGLLVSLSFLLQHEAQRKEDFYKSAWAEIYSKTFYVFFGIVFSFFTSVLGLILVSAFAALGKLMLLREYGFNLLINKPSKTTFKADLSLLATYKNRALGMVVSNSILVASGSLPLFFIASEYGANTLGQFVLVMSTIFLPSGLIGAAVGNVFYQRGAKLWGQQDTNGLKQLWKDTIIKLLLFSIPTYLFVFLISKWGYPFVFGSQWQQAGEFAQLLTLTAFFSFIAGPMDRISLIAGIGSYLPFIHSIRLAFLFTLIWLLKGGSFSPEHFVFYYAICMSVVYLLDLILGRLILNTKSY